ncbi:MAG: septal ring lytic transglycosylase RlpA family protein [Sphingomonas sp.]|uniref:septal ring lytic transglycosylase RlpA family protein n=1 Tax=Sphingomonas sp. TaxID=28214 RepID=UPI0017E25687|nr:hypothetical protein [Zymomonas sp.]MBA4773793.1 septal ring lytic transglycosylase RlpA family protein [Sphingomonas sp.]
MMLIAAFAAMVLTQEAPPPDLPEGAGPRGTSQAFGAARYDAVGYASWYGEEMTGRTASGAPFDPAAITAAHRTLPFGTIVEVTSLDSGRTILVLINDRGPHAVGRIIDLSRGAAELLGMKQKSVAPVRIRIAEVSATDQAALQRGQAASARLDASPQLTAALRKRLGTGNPSVASAPARSPARPSPTPLAPRPTDAAPPPRQAGDGRYVQVAAFSSRARAQALATSLGGRVDSLGTIHRVRLGPFTSQAQAQAARDRIARQGYADARIVANRPMIDQLARGN